MKKLFNIIKSLFNDNALQECINNGLVSFEGQGRNKYGK